LPERSAAPRSACLWLSWTVDRSASRSWRRRDRMPCCLRWHARSHRRFRSPCLLLRHRGKSYLRIVTVGGAPSRQVTSSTEEGVRVSNRRRHLDRRFETSCQVFSCPTLNRLSEGNFRPIVSLALVESLWFFQRPYRHSCLVIFGAKITITPAAIEWQAVPTLFES
jgi:hypothetical protein